MKKRKLNKVILFILIFCISIGFAYLSATLNINGSAFLRQNTWNIYFDNVEVQEESIELSEGDQQPTIDSDKTTVSYKVTFNNPGDEYIFNIDTVNDGTLHAQIDLIETTDIPEELQNIAYIKLEYLDGTEVKVGDVLMAGSTKTLKVITGYKEDITEEDLPTEEQKLSYSITINYKQIKESDIKTATFKTGREMSEKMMELSGSIPRVSTYSDPTFNSFNYASISPTFLKYNNQELRKINSCQSKNEGSVYVKAFKRSQNIIAELDDNNIVSTEDSKVPIYMWYSADEENECEPGIIYWFSEADIVYLNEDSSYFFNYFKSIKEGTTTSNYNGNFDTLNDISGLSMLSTKKVKFLNGFFIDCFYLSNISPLSNWDISNIKHLGQMFENCNKLEDISILSEWDVSKASDLYSMFRSCTNLSDISPLSNWNISRATNISYFFNSTGVTDLAPLTNWNVSSVEEMNNVFDSINITDISPLRNWNTSSVKSLRYLFYNTNISDLTPLSNWDVSNVTDMYALFALTNITNLTPLSNWNVSNVQNMGNLFLRCYEISDINPIKNWDVRNVERMDQLFCTCSSLTDITPLENWTTSSLENTSSMFQNTNILDARCLESWDVSNIKNMSGMFQDTPITSSTKPSWYTLSL